MSQNGSFCAVIKPSTLVPAPPPQSKIPRPGLPGVESHSAARGSAFRNACATILDCTRTGRDRPIHVQQNPGWRGRGSDQGAGARTGAIGKAAFSPAQNQGIDHQHPFIDQPVLKQQWSQGGASPHNQVGACFRFETANTPHDVFPQSLGRPPTQALRPVGPQAQRRSKFGLRAGGYQSVLAE